MNSLKALASAVALVGFVSVAQATDAPTANLLDVQGKILVDHGKGFAAVSGSALQAGDRILVGDKASATVAFAGCSVKLDKPTMFVVGKAAPCAKGVTAMNAGSVFISPAADAPMGAGAAGAGAAGAGAAGAAGAAAAPIFGGIGPAILIVPAALAGGIILLTSKS